MNWQISPLKLLVIIGFLLAAQASIAQKSKVKSLNYTMTPDFIRSMVNSKRFQPPFDYLYHSPDELDKQNLKKYGYLLAEKPTAANYVDYYNLACSLWDLNKLQEEKYPVTYTCGTGFYTQKDKYDFLYAACYEGLKKFDEVLELLLPGCLDRRDDIIVRSIKNKYNQAEIKNYLTDAEASMQIFLDTFPSYSYQTTYSKGRKEKTRTLTYYSGSATITLFGKIVEISKPYLKDGERVTKAYFIKKFKESHFYLSLAEVAGISTDDSTAIKI